MKWPMNEGLMIPTCSIWANVQIRGSLCRIASCMSRSACDCKPRVSCCRHRAFSLDTWEPGLTGQKIAYDHFCLMPSAAGDDWQSLMPLKVRPGELHA